MKLVNCFRDCVCGHPLRFDDTDAVRICPKCGKKVQLAENEKQAFIKYEKPAVS